MADIQLICNPTAGNGLGEKTGREMAELLKKKNISFELLLTERPGHATELARQAAAQGVKKVASIGGDGTLLEVAEGLCRTKTALGVIPAGTGNDFIKTIGIPKDPVKALDCFISLPPKKTDTVRINDRMFLNETGTGFDVMVLDYAEKAKKHVKGLLPYLYGVIRTIFHFRGVHLSLSVDGGPEEEKDILVLAAGNGRFIGGGIPIAPDAVPDDGLLDLVVVGRMNRLRMLSALPGLMKGSILSFKESSFSRVRKLTLTGRDLRINIDGEILAMNRAEIEVQPGTLLVCRP